MNFKQIQNRMFEFLSVVVIKTITPSFQLKDVFCFLVDRRNGKAIINSHTQVEVSGIEPRLWHSA